MKSPKTNDEAIELFSKCQQKFDVNNLHSDGLTLWSYEEPIARKFPNSSNEWYAWVTNRRFSVTTSRHTSTVAFELGRVGPGYKVVRTAEYPEDVRQLLSNAASEAIALAADKGRAETRGQAVLRRRKEKEDQLKSFRVAEIQKLITRGSVIWSVQAEFDDVAVRGNVLASGDPKLDKEAEDNVLKRLADGDVWAWASASVMGTWNGLEEKDRIGTCFYADEQDFKECSYYADMQDVVLSRLRASAMKLTDSQWMRRKDRLSQREQKALTKAREEAQW